MVLELRKLPLPQPPPRAKVRWGSRLSPLAQCAHPECHAPLCKQRVYLLKSQHHTLGCMGGGCNVAWSENRTQCNLMACQDYLICMFFRVLALLCIGMTGQDLKSGPLLEAFGPVCNTSIFQELCTYVECLHRSWHATINLTDPIQSGWVIEVRVLSDKDGTQCLGHTRAGAGADIWRDSQLAEQQCRAPGSGSAPRLSPRPGQQACAHDAGDGERVMHLTHL